MFDVSTVSKRYFGVKLTATDENDQVHRIELEIEPPKVKTIKKLMAVSKSAQEDQMDELAEAVRKMLSKNKSDYEVPMEYIDNFSYDELQGILEAYFNWLNKEKSSPN